MRVKAVIAYDGSAFYGFQRQTEPVKTVSGTLHTAMRRLGIDSFPVGSGRTDRGVHATGQIVHFDIPYHWQDSLFKLKIMLNRLLAPHIQLKHISGVNKEFHARFDAKRRIYRYVFKSVPLTPFEAPYCRFLQNFDEKKFKSALELFEGEHDFDLFHKKGSDPGTTIRTVYKTGLYRFQNYLIATFEANGFLRAQVRIMVETAIRTMKNELTKNDILMQLNGEKVFNIKPAPPQGLYLSRVLY